MKNIIAIIIIFICVPLLGQRRVILNPFTGDLQYIKADDPPLVESNSIYDSESVVMEPTIAHLGGNKVIVVFYDNTVGRYVVYSKISNDYGQTWGDAVAISDVSKACRNSTITYLDNGRLVLFYRDGSNYVYTRYSNNKGTTWSGEVNITESLDQTYSPYGHTIETSNGYMQCFSGNKHLEALFSSDGINWGDRVTIVDHDADTTRDAAEPMPLRVTDNNILCYFRQGLDENDSTHIEYGVTKSTDGGLTWSTPQYMDGISMQNNPTHIWVKKTRDNEARFTIARRNQDETENGVYTAKTDVKSLWESPYLLENLALSIVYSVSIDSTNIQIRSPDFVQIGDYALATWEKDNSIYVGSIIDGSPLKYREVYFPLPTPESGDYHAITKSSWDELRDTYRFVTSDNLHQVRLVCRMKSAVAGDTVHARVHFTKVIDNPAIVDGDNYYFTDTEVSVIGNSWKVVDSNWVTLHEVFAKWSDSSYDNLFELGLQVYSTKGEEIHIHQATTIMFR